MTGIGRILREMKATPATLHGETRAAGEQTVVLRGMSPASDGTQLTRHRSGKALNNLELADNLCAVSQALREARRMHVRQFGALIPHLFMGDVLARAGACVALGTAHALREHRREIEEIIAAIEQGLARGDRETRNVIAVSFVNDAELEQFFDELRPFLGARALAQLRGR